MTSPARLDKRRTDAPITQQNAFKSLARLERELGALINRSPRPTDAKQRARAGRAAAAIFLALEAISELYDL